MYFTGFIVIRFIICVVLQFSSIGCSMRMQVMLKIFVLPYFIKVYL